MATAVQTQGHNLKGITGHFVFIPEPQKEITLLNGREHFMTWLSPDELEEVTDGKTVFVEDQVQTPAFPIVKKFFEICAYSDFRTGSVPQLAPGDSVVVPDIRGHYKVYTVDKPDAHWVKQAHERSSR